MPQENDPKTNMAIDEAILDGYVAGICPPTIRFYTWKPEGISLGYFQKAETILNIKQCLQQNVAFVRRITGGEAIFHGDDISYSIILSEDDLGLKGSVKNSFRSLTSFILNAYKEFGLKPSFFSDIESKQLNHSSFCFAMARDFDIAIDGKKIGGNAQKRLKRIIFQHGSIPVSLNIDRINTFLREDLERSKTNITSLDKILGKSIKKEEVIERLTNSFQKTFNIKLKNDVLSEAEKEIAKNLRKIKYDNENWNFAKATLAE